MLNTAFLFASSGRHRLRRGGTWIQRWRVPLGFLCAAFFVLFARPRPTTLLIGAGVSIGAGRCVLGVLFAVLFRGISFPLMRVESATMGQYFGEDFRNYSRAVP